jgi:hypothetical protein
MNASILEQKYWNLRHLISHKILIDSFILSLCLKYTCMKRVCDADKVAVSNFNGWFHDNYVSEDHII